MSALDQTRACADCALCKCGHTGEAHGHSPPHGCIAQINPEGKTWKERLCPCVRFAAAELADGGDQ